MNFYKTLAFWILVSSKGFALVALLNSPLFPLIFIPLAAISLSIILEKNSFVRKIQIMLSVLFLYYDPVLPSLMLVTYMGIKSIQLFFDGRLLPFMLAASEIALSIMSIVLVPLTPLTALANGCILGGGLKALKKQWDVVCNNIFTNSASLNPVSPINDLQDSYQGHSFLGDAPPQLGLPVHDRNAFQIPQFNRANYQGNGARQQYFAPAAPSAPSAPGLPHGYLYSYQHHAADNFPQQLPLNLSRDTYTAPPAPPGMFL